MANFNKKSDFPIINTMTKSIKAKRIIVKGKVQGVGFRPFVYKKAIKNNLVGYVINDSKGVTILVQGKEYDLAKFEKELLKDPPPISQIVNIYAEDVPVDKNLTSFEIRESRGENSHEVLISPDIATCSMCEEELFDPKNKRFLFPFINCTNCGPRFTITRKIPYDRENTSMACFPMCEDCLKEYTDPLNRRFHAQPNCCGRCGPEICLLNKEERCVSQGTTSIEYAAIEIAEKKVVAIKGLGGFHICCRADDIDIIKKLRNLKKRPFKPFAIMASSLEDVEKIAHISEFEKTLLNGNIRPIVLLHKKKNALPKEIAPDTRYIGVMLPYTPIHHILFYFYKKYKKGLPYLIMTSGNKASQPICTGNREAISALKDFVDYFLIHNRDILIRCDDSVISTRGKNKILFYRRARGYVPSPVFLKNKLPPSLGVGAELKNTICLIDKDRAFVSQYIGDLKNLETYNFFIDTVSHFKDILKIRPKAIGTDMHPDYMSTRYAEEHNLPLIKVQHHHAHILSVIAENKIEEDVIGISLDGAGLGDDRTIWGGEIFIVFKNLSYKRVGHLFPVKLPGGESAIKNIWKMGLSYLYEARVTDIDKYLLNIDTKSKKIVMDMIDKNINCQITTSCGRLFDAVSAILGLKTSITYEGEGAIALENIQDGSLNISYNIPVIHKDDLYILDTITLIKDIIDDKNKGVSASIISRKFHVGICNGLGNLVYKVSKKSGIKKVALSGGVFQNKTISTYLQKILKEKGLYPIFNRELPPNDENISLGQAYFVSYKLRGL